MHKRNPYTNGGVIRDDVNFYNRLDIVNELSIPNSKAHYIRGNRRIGKTSLLRQIERKMLHTPRVIPVYFSLEGAQNLLDIQQFFQRALQLACRNSRVEEFNCPNGFLEAFIFSLEQFAKLDKHLYLLIDEAEALLHLDPHVRSKFRRELVNMHDHLTVAVSATNRLQQLDIQKTGSTDLLEGFDIINIRPFSKTDALSLIYQKQNPVDEVIVDEAVAHDILKYAGTHPFLIQRLCFNLFENGVLRGVQPGDYALTQELRNFLTIDFNLLTAEQQSVLQQFSWQESKASTEITKFPLSTINESLAELERLGFLANENNEYTLSNYYLAQWLEEQQSKALKPQKRTTSISKLNPAKGIRALTDDLFEKKLPTKKTPTPRSNNASSNSTQTGKLSPVQIKAICDYIDSNMEAAFEAMDKLDWGNHEGTYNDKKAEWIDPGIGFNKTQFRERLKLLLKSVFK